MGSLLPRDTPLIPEQLHRHKAARFNINVDDMPAQEFFLSLAQNAPYNIVAKDGVNGHITLHLKHVTLPEVMKTVQDVYGFAYQHVGNTWIIDPNRLQTQVFQINYLDITRKATSRTRVTSGQTTSSDTLGLYGAAGLYGGAYGGLGTPYGRNGEYSRPLESGSKVQTKSNSNFWSSITKALNAIVGKGKGRKVVVNPNSGVIVVRALPATLRTVREFIDQVQTNVHREVVIEARIIQVTLNKGFQTGINWAQLMHAGSGKSVILGQVGGQNLFNNGTSDLQGLPLTLQPNNPNPITGFPSSAFGGTFAAALNLGNFNAFIELLKSQGQIHVLSSPRTATLDNQDAVIKVGHDEFFVTGVNSNTIAGAATTSASNIELTPFFSGVALDVTPQIDSDGEVTLYIHPTVSNVTDQNKNITVGGEQNELPLAYSEVRESDSVVRAASGQIVVIGGLMKNQTSYQNYSVPLLGDIPFLGNFFKEKKQEEQKTELVILLKPIIVGKNGTWARYSKKQRQALQQLEQRGG